MHPYLLQLRGVDVIVAHREIAHVAISIASLCADCLQTWENVWCALYSTTTARGDWELGAVVLKWVIVSFCFGQGDVEWHHEA